MRGQGAFFQVCSCAPYTHLSLTVESHTSSGSIYTNVDAATWTEQLKQDRKGPNAPWIRIDSCEIHFLNGEQGRCDVASQITPFSQTWLVVRMSFLVS